MAYTGPKKFSKKVIHISNGKRTSKLLVYHDIGSNVLI